MSKKNLFYKIKVGLISNARDSEPLFFSLGLVLIIAFPGFHIYNKFFAVPHGYESFFLRMTIASLGVLLVSTKQWKEKYNAYKIILFYFSILFSFPFFFSFMLFNNQSSNIWQINELTGLVLLAFFLDWRSFIVFSVTGVVLAYIICKSLIKDFYIIPEIIGVFGSYSAPIIYFAIFARKRIQIIQIKEDYHKKIIKINLELEEKVEERTSELKQALAAKTEFLNNMSHEVRTPIQGIVNVSQGLVDHWSTYKNEERLFFASKVAEYSKRLISLVSNLLDLSKFGAGKMRFRLSEIDLIDLSQDMINECRDLYVGDKKIELIFRSSIEHAPIVCDADKITQVLRNLFANSIKFTPKGVITISVDKATIEIESDSMLNRDSDRHIYSNKDTYTSEDDNTQDRQTIKKTNVRHTQNIEAYKLTISDEGVGIPIGEETAIFDPFTQSSRTKTRAGGTGLGLSICKKIIDAHSGRIFASNNQRDEDIVRASVEITSYIKQYVTTKVSHEMIESMPTLPGASFSFIIPIHFNKHNLDIDLIDNDDDEI